MRAPDGLALRTADALAELCLSGNLDKQGRPLIEHVRRVGAACSGLSDERRLAALLHECIEDGGLDERSIALIFGDPVADLVGALSRRPGEDYMGRYIASMPKLCPRAVPVKLADLADNLDPSRGSIPDSLRRRYERAREILISSAAEDAHAGR